MQARLHLTAAATTVLFILAAMSTTLLDTHRTARRPAGHAVGATRPRPHPGDHRAATGFGVAGTSADPRITAKKRRMSFIAGIGLLLLTPAAFALHQLASHGEFGAPYFIVTTVEALAAVTSLALMAGNIRDGLRLAARR